MWRGGSVWLCVGVSVWLLGRPSGVHSKGRNPRVGVFVRGRVFVCLFPGACSFGCVGVSVWLCVGVAVWLCVGVLVGVRACLCVACVWGVCVRVSFCGCVRLRAFACACVFVCVRVCPSLGPARDPSGFSRRGKD